MFWIGLLLVILGTEVALLLFAAFLEADAGGWVGILLAWVALNIILVAVGGVGGLFVFGIHLMTL